MSTEGSPTAVDIFVQALHEQGFRPTIDDTEVDFKFEGERFSVQTFPDDEKYFAVVLRYTAGADKARCLAALNEINDELKAVKSCYYDERGAVVFSIEGFYDDPRQFAAHFDRVLGALRNASDRFFALLRSAERDEV